MKLNQKGLSFASILKEIKQLKELDFDYTKGRLFSLVYYLGEKYSKFLNDAFYLFFSANGLNPGAFRSLKALERNIISITADLFHADENACGVVTSGGTESCLLAVKTYRDYARKVKRIKSPEMIVADTAHVAWFKGAEYFNVKIHIVPSLPKGGADVAAIKKKINRNTILILGSAPEYPHGIIDPIVELGKIAEKKNIPLHVDACVGGFLLPFIERLGRPLPLWDFRVSAVTSISADIHKYGFAAKGASTIIYRSQEHFEHQLFVYEDWPGGIFASPALLGTRPGGSYSAAYAALRHHGINGYTKLAEQALAATDALQKGIRALDLSIMGEPQATLFAYRSKDPAINIFVVGDLMEKRGWHIDRIQKPDALHAMVTPGHLPVVKEYLRDLKASIQEAKANPQLAKEGAAATYGMIAHAPFRRMVKDEVRKMFADTYRIAGGDLNLTENDFSATDTERKLSLKDRLIHWIIERQQAKERTKYNE